jgi:transcription termination/antitermination protein NusG
MAVDKEVQDISESGADTGNQHESWFAVQTRPRHEKTVAGQLHRKGVTTFLPTVTEVHRWSDRKKTVELPLFSCYVFVRLMPGNEDRQKVLRVDSVLGFAGNPGLGTPIPEEQIEAIRTLMEKKIPYSIHPFLKTGQRVRIRNGVLEGIEGILLSRKGDQRLIISVEAMQRSLAVEIDGYDVEPL